MAGSKNKNSSKKVEQKVQFEQKVSADEFAGIKGFNPRNKSAFIRMYGEEMKTIKQWELITKNKF